jgi:hypothetical protein
MQEDVVIRDSANNHSPSERVCAPVKPERDGNVLESRHQTAFVLSGPTEDIFRVMRVFNEILIDHPEIVLVYQRSSLGRLWIVEGKPDG